jgi:hypothetical protein
MPRIFPKCQVSARGGAAIGVRREVPPPAPAENLQCPHDEPRVRRSPEFGRSRTVLLAESATSVGRLPLDCGCRGFRLGHIAGVR